MSAMKAKMVVTSFTKFVGSEKLTFCGVSKQKYEGDGLDEDNTYARFSPQADLSITITNPALLGKFEAGQKFYVDFVEVESE